MDITSWTAIALGLSLYLVRPVQIVIQELRPGKRGVHEHIEYTRPVIQIERLEDVKLRCVQISVPRWVRSRKSVKRSQRKLTTQRNPTR